MLRSLQVTSPALHHIFQPELDGVHAQFFGDRIQLLLPGGAGGNPAVAALGPAGRLVGVDPPPVVLHVGQLVWAAQQASGVVDRRDPEAGIGAAVEMALVLQGQQGAVFFDAGGHAVHELVPGAAQHEDLLARIDELDRLSGLARQQAGDELAGVGGGLDAETAADVGLDHPHLAHRQPQHHGQGALDVVGRLRRAVQGQAAVQVENSDAAGRLDEGTVLAFVLEGGGFDEIARLQGLGHVAELLVHLGGNVARELGVQLWRPLGHGLLDGQYGRQLLVIDLDQADGFLGCFHVDGRYRSDLIADIAHPVVAENGLVVAGRADPVAHQAGISICDHRLDPRQAFGPGSVDF